MIDLSNNVGRSISIIKRHMTAYMARKMEPLEIGPGQYSFLFTLYLEDGQSQQSLSNRLLLDKAATVRAINKLEETGYVSRQVDPEDRRSMKVFLTDKGREIRPRLEAIVSEVLKALLSDFDLEEREMLKIYLNRLVKNIVAVNREKLPESPNSKEAD